MKRRLAALLLAGLLFGVTLPARADPALFLIDGGTAPLYLFGSVHVLRPGLAWRTPRFNHILAECQEYWFETTEQPAAATILQLIPALDFLHPLHSLLPPADYALITRKLGADSPALTVVDHMRPWLVALVIDAADLMPHGSTAAVPGVDVQLMDGASKPVHGLETLTDIVTLMNAVPDRDQIAFLHEALGGAKGGGTALVALQNAWAAGNLVKLRALTQEMQAATPNLFNTLLKQRNARWLDELDTLLHGGKPVLVTVGAAHLIGPDGLLALLRARGYTTTRIQ